MSGRPKTKIVSECAPDVNPLIGIKQEEKRRKAREYARQYRIDHPEKIEQFRESCRRWRRNNPGEQARLTKLWQKNNPEKAKEIKRKWYKNNRDKANIMQKRYRDNNPEKFDQYHKDWELRNEEQSAQSHCNATNKWRQTHPLEAKEMKNRRRALEKNAVTEKINTEKIYERDKWICGICGRKVNKNLKYPNKFSAVLDHVLPLSKGGSHTEDNIQLAHWLCNVRALSCIKTPALCRKIAISTQHKFNKETNE